MTRVLNGIGELATHMLDELESGRGIEIDISARDAETGSLLVILLAPHEAAIHRGSSVEISQRNEITLRLSVPSAGN